MKTVIIVQARMASRRLHGKVLLEAAGKPMLQHQLERLRKVKKADEIVVATTVNEHDDAIVALCRRMSIACYRGSEHDVLQRYYETALHYDAEIIARITGDCPLLDPEIVDKAIECFLKASESNSNIYVSNTLQRTFPRGFDVEVFSMDVLKQANFNAQSSFDREHVTPWIIRNDGAYFSHHNIQSDINLSAYRFTLDYQRDYGQLSRLIELMLLENQMSGNYQEIIKIARRHGLLLSDNKGSDDLNENPQSYNKYIGARKDVFSRFGLGTAQFGMYYGAFNQDGVPSEQEISRILKYASDMGISVLDTARLYGVSEEILGRCMPEDASFKIVTKTVHFNVAEVDDGSVTKLLSNFDTSLKNLKQSSVYGFLIHNSQDLLAKNGEKLYNTILRLKEEGRVQKIGFSMYSDKTANEILSRFAVDLIQVPINVLDQRLIHSGFLKSAKALGVEIHARSVFLQGLLLADPASISGRLEPAIQKIAAFQRIAQENHLTPAQAALKFLYDIDEIDIILFGVESFRQMEEILKGFNEEVRIDFSDFFLNIEEILNPILWKS